MGKKYRAVDLRFRQFVDNKAERWLLRYIPLIESEYLTREVLNYYDVDGRAVRMVEMINIVITATQHDDQPVGFIAAQVDCDQAVAILHMLYVLPSRRRQGASKLLLQMFELVMKRLIIKSIIAGVASTVSRDLIREHAAGSELTYEIREASELVPGVED